MATQTQHDDDRYVIRRSDGRLYVGTVDKEPIFTTAPVGTTIPGTFTKQHATRRLRGLRKQNKQGHTFEVVPLEDVHAG